jgi:hypothetical protein
MNWRDRPLTSYRTIVQLIADPTTKKGLKVQAGSTKGATQRASRSLTKSSQRYRSRVTSSRVPGTAPFTPNRSNKLRAGR